MDIDQIRTFVAIARTKNFSRAAEALHRSQPAISRRIDLLARELGAPLFERAGATLSLSDAGAALLPHAEAALAAIRDGEESVRAIKGGEAGRVALAVVGTLANDALTATLRRFNKRHPKVHVDIQTATSREVCELVRRGDAHLGLRYGADPVPGLVSTVVAREALIVVSAPDHPLARRKPVRPAELAGERWVAFRQGAARETFVQVLGRLLAAAGLDAPEIVPIDSLTAQKRLVEANLGIALLAESGVREELRRKMLGRINVPELKGSIPVSVVHRRDGYLSPACRNFLAAVSAGWAKS
jgi:DNA-binding transcriptional LysR family regulator